MRVANKTIYDNVTINLGRVTEALWKANEVVSTARKINDLSDDPVGLAKVLDLRSSLASVDQLGRNIEVGKSWLCAAESSLTQTQDLLSEIKSLCVQMSSATVGTSERQNASTQVDGYLRQLLDLANEQVGGRYIFSGSKTDTPPFALDNEGNPTTVVYSGDDAPFSIRIGRNMTVEIGRDGQEAFGTAPNSLFDLIIDLKDYLANDDVSGIRQVMGELDSEMESVRSLISNTGARLLRLETKEKVLSDVRLNYEDRKSQIEAADIAEAIMSLKEKELAYQAALSSSSKVMGLSLVDYM